MRKITMTRNFHSLAGVIALGLMTLSCTGNYLDINTNPYEVNREQTLTDGYATAAAIAAMGGAVVSTDVNTAQFTDCLLGGPMEDITPRQVHSKRPLTITMRQTTGREYCSQVTGLSLHFTPTFRSSRV